MRKVHQFLSLVTCLVLMAAAAVGSHGRLLGYDFATGTDAPAFYAEIDWESLATPKFILTALVVLAAAIAPIWVHNRHYRTAQLALNVGIVGLWSGTFLSYEMMLGMLSNGIQLGMSILVIVMLIVAFIFPLFNRPNHYCMWMCPLGSAQELMGKVNKKHKWHMSKKTTHALDIFREVLWGLLMLTLWLGLGFSWTDYELFTAFLFQVAPWGVLVAAGCLLIISAFMPRPYCRFICPTGSLFKLAQDKGEEKGSATSKKPQKAHKE